MKAFLLSENLQKKLSFINHAVSLRSQLPILLNILIEAKNGKLKISSTDLEIGIQVEIPANIEEEGAITVPAKIFSDLINSLPQEKVLLETNNGSLIVKTRKTKSNFQTIPKEEFPKLYEEKGEKIVSLKKEELNNNFTKVVFAASTDSSRPALSGVLIKKEENGLLLVATDGYRLSLKRQKEDKTSSLKGQGQFLIPARVIKEMLGLKDQEESINIYTLNKNNQILLEQANTLLVGRLIDAEFPVYEKIIPQNFTTRFFIEREELQNAVKMSAIFARESANIIKFLIKKDKLIVSANMPSVGDNIVEIEIKLEGEENEIAFNAHYLLDFLAYVEESDLVFEMTGALNPGVFKIKDDSSFLHLIMPIRVQG